MMVKIGILHPGAMGVSVAASAKNSGNEIEMSNAHQPPVQSAHHQQYRSDYIYSFHLLLSFCYRSLGSKSLSAARADEFLSQNTGRGSSTNFLPCPRSSVQHCHQFLTSRCDIVTIEKINVLLIQIVRWLSVRVSNS